MSLKTIHCGKLIDGTGRPTQKNTIILIEGNKIKKIGKKHKMQIPNNATIIDASDKIVVPGLIDSHVHFLATGYRLGHYQIGHKTSIREIAEGLEDYVKVKKIPEKKWIHDEAGDFR